MPVKKGPVTFARFRAAATKAKPKDLRRSHANGLRRHAFEPLDRQDEEDRSAGWVELDNPDKSELAPGSFTFADWLLVSWRVDALRIPASMVRGELEAWARGHAAEHGQPPRRQEKKAQKELILKKLRRRAFIASKTFDVAWNTSNDLVQIWSSSRKVIEEIQIAFEESFGVHLKPLSPGGLAELAETDPAQLEPTAALFGTDVALEANANVEP